MVSTRVCLVQHGRHTAVEKIFLLFVRNLRAICKIGRDNHFRAPESSRVRTTRSFVYGLALSALMRAESRERRRAAVLRWTTPFVTPRMISGCASLNAACAAALSPD